MVLLNLDAGEHDDEPAALWEQADLVCVACGGHAGDAASMERLVAFCAARDRPQLGAHPSYPDREGFGRRTMTIEPAALTESLATQCRTLATIAAARGLTVGWVKPHGALYHDANRDPALARIVVDSARAALGTPTIVGPPAGALRDVALAAGLRYLREGFADRRVRADGTLVPRTEPNALITDPEDCAARARVLAREVDTICVHADTLNAPAIASAVRAALDENALDASARHARNATMPDASTAPALNATTLDTSAPHAGTKTTLEANAPQAAFQSARVETPVRIEALGDRALRFARQAASPRAIVRAVKCWPGVIDVVVTRDEIAVYFAEHVNLPFHEIAALAAARDDDDLPVREHVLRVVYDGVDLDDVARATRLSIDDVIARHQAATYTVAMMGFAPGFAYLDGLDAALHVPRRATPRERVPAGSLAIAGGQTAVYPFDSPGGWHLIGRVVDARVFDPIAGPLLALGDRVRFTR